MELSKQEQENSISGNGVPELRAIGTQPKAKSSTSTFAIGAVQDADGNVQQSLIVSVSNGHLKYGRFPILIGHFENDGILSAEKVIDIEMNNEISKRLNLGEYPGAIGSSASLDTAKGENLKGVLVVGLGKQGQLNEFQLIKTIEQGACAYLIEVINKAKAATRHTENPVIIQKLGLSALIVGSGYGGLGIEGASRAILQGVQNANSRVVSEYKKVAKTIDEVEFIEIYTDRALACAKAVSKLEMEASQSLRVKRSGNSINYLPGRRTRLPVEDTKEWWTRITVQRHIDPANLDKRRQGLRFAVSTDAARVEEASLDTDSNDLFQLLEKVSADENWTSELAKVIFEMLIPNDFKQQVKRQNNISWQLDELTAAFPWELLQDSVMNAKPLSVNAGMIRQLVTSDFRRAVNSVTDNTALVIADPELDDFFGQLPGARKEGENVAKLLEAKNYNVSKLPKGGKAADVRVKLLGKDYRIVHLAGHGVFEYGKKKSTGMVIGKNAFLTPSDIKQMSGVPELVFVNCCYLGKTNAESNQYNQSRYRLAANVGTQLIEIGVKAVVVAGWAVNDAAALEFANKFYDALFAGSNFGESVKLARQAIYKDGIANNTWGAYQCYGDPFYRLKQPKQSPSYKYSFIIPEEAEIELGNLLNQLDTGDYDVNEYSKKMDGMAEAMKTATIRNARITELQALLYARLGMYKHAIDKFAALGIEEKAVYSFSASEQYCNTRAKYNVQQRRSKSIEEAEAIKEIECVIDDIKGLNRFGNTIERLNLLGSSYKRLALVNESKIESKIAAYESSAKYYQLALMNPDSKNKFYPMANWLAIENALVLSARREWGKKYAEFPLPQNAEEAVSMLKDELDSQSGKGKDEKNFWDFAALANINLCFFQLGVSGIDYENVLNAYREVWKYTGHKGNRLAELEHLDFLEDLYKTVRKPEADRILDLIARLKVDLEAIA